MAFTAFTLFYSSDPRNFEMEAVNEVNMVLQLPKFNFNGKNKQEFLQKWPQVARHFEIEDIISEAFVRPHADIFPVASGM